ncbi:MAG: hypothetical protein PHO89_08245 [Methylacidiphilaceae bacterium]|nr:hypothetical protein [Candidatus Methylacidiphilaceae bacterium]
MTGVVEEEIPAGHGRASRRRSPFAEPKRIRLSRRAMLSNGERIAAFFFGCSH